MNERDEEKTSDQVPNRFTRDISMQSFLKKPYTSPFNPNRTSEIESNSPADSTFGLSSMEKELKYLLLASIFSLVISNAGKRSFHL